MRSSAFVHSSTNITLASCPLLFLSSWRTRSVVRAVRLRGEAVIFDVKSQAIAREIAQHERTRSLCTLVGKSQLVVEASGLEKFREALREVGSIAGV